MSNSLLNAWREQAKNSRLSLSFYTDPDGLVDRRPFIVTVFFFLLRSVCLTLEVFLHNRMGKSYITEPKALLGCLFPYLCLFLAQVQFAFIPQFNIARPYGVEIVTPFVKALRTANWEETGDRLHSLFIAFADEQSFKHVLAPVTIAVSLFGFLVNLKFVLSLLAEHLWKKRRHPYSSGDPYFFWDFAYVFCWRFNIRFDIVKVLLEPALCFFIGWKILSSPSKSADPLAEPYKFIGMWLVLGSLALLMRAYLESRKRHKLMMDQLANQLNAEAFQAQEKMTSPMKRDGFDVVPASGRV